MLSISAIWHDYYTMNCHDYCTIGVSTHGIQMRVLVSLERFWVSKKLVFSSIRFFSGVRRGATAYRDSYTYTRLLQQNDIDTKSLQQIHAQIITSGYEQNQFVAAKLVSQYTEQSGSNVVEDARKVFDCVRERDVLLWNVIIRCYANSGPFREATNVYDEMRGDGVLPNRYTFPFVLKACASMRDGIKGQVIHGHVVIAGLESDLFVGNALVAFYGKCCEIKIARKVFDEMLCKDIVSWNSMISGYAQNECSNEALLLLHQMLQDEDNVRVPDRATFVGILPACAQAAAIQEGMWIHGFIIKTGMEVDVALGSGLISMYGNCGLLDSAHALFNSLSEKNIIVWNAIIRSYGMHGHADKALELFSEMVETGIKPDGISLVCILSACSHAGLVEKGKEIFKRMNKDFGVEKTDEHYACMVDLLGRAGYLDEAVEFIKTMLVKAGKDVYGALLGACRIHSNIELAEEVAERLFVLDPYNAGRYILLAKMYEDAGRWRDAANVRKRMREKRIRKPLGCSGVEVDSVMHTFGAEDEKHEMSEQIFDTLQLLKMSNEFEEEEMY